MADITFEDGGGNQRTVPEWATEVTLKQLVQVLSGKESKEEQSLNKPLPPSSLQGQTR